MTEKLCDVVEKAIKPAFTLLPARMRSREAVVMLLAIGLQESLFKYRRQMGDGPSRGLWQFEKGGGVAGVMKHTSSAELAQFVCRERQVPQWRADVFIISAYNQLEHDDVLAAAFARLLLWTDPKPLPALNDVEAAWQLYLRTWRPGAYTRGTAEQKAALRKKWGGYYAIAMQEVSKCSA
ncbi:MAG: hypothetical protein RBR45_11650 [Pseudomonas sp.]|nr:hypothetical protein [Pseudomonas sp.]